MKSSERQRYSLPSDTSTLFLIWEIVPQWRRPIAQRPRGSQHHKDSRRSRSPNAPFRRYNLRRHSRLNRYISRYTLQSKRLQSTHLYALRRRHRKIRPSRKARCHRGEGETSTNHRSKSICQPREEEGGRTHERSKQTGTGHFRRPVRK